MACTDCALREKIILECKKRIYVASLCCQSIFSATRPPAALITSMVFRASACGISGSGKRRRVVGIYGKDLIDITGVWRLFSRFGPPKEVEDVY